MDVRPENPVVVAADHQWCGVSVGSVFVGWAGWAAVLVVLPGGVVGVGALLRVLGGCGVSEGVCDCVCRHGCDDCGSGRVGLVVVLMGVA